MAGVYSCPMHPQVRESGPGRCPECGMALELTEATEPATPAARKFHIPWSLGACVFLGIVAVFLWEEHRAHLLGALPYILLLACPLIHLFMHGSHGHRHGSHSSRG